MKKNIKNSLKISQKKWLYDLKMKGTQTKEDTPQTSLLILNQVQKKRNCFKYESREIATNTKNFL